MPIIEAVNGTAGEMLIEGRLTFNDSSEFRKKLNGLIAQGINSLLIKLSSLQFMDSAGLGMLIVTLEECKKNSIKLSLHEPRNDVKKLLQATGCYERFQILD